MAAILSAAAEIDHSVQNGDLVLEVPVGSENESIDELRANHLAVAYVIRSESSA
jgi:hypothetical protein